MNAVPLLLNDPATGEPKFIGDLDAGKKVACAERHVEERGPDTTIRVFQVWLYSDPWDDTPSEVGIGPTLDQAWRVALGALFGPIDSEYDEDHLRAVLLDAALS